MLRCIIGPNLEIWSWIGAEWWHGQAQNMAFFYFEVKFDLEVQGQLPPKTIGILTKVFCSSSPNLVILARTGDKLSRGQASDYRTHRRTHRQTQATTIPEGQNWPRVKMDTGALCDLNRTPVVMVKHGGSCVTRTHTLHTHTHTRAYLPYRNLNQIEMICFWFLLHYNVALGSFSKCSKYQIKNPDKLLDKYP